MNTAATQKQFTDLEQFLNTIHEGTWAESLAELLPSIHEVDKNATRIWFKFFPLELHQAFENAEDPEALARQLLIQGDYRLKNQIDSSHKFLYGHRYWPEVKQAVSAHLESFRLNQPTTLADQILTIARSVADQRKTHASLITGITAVAFMTLRQVGATAFKESGGQVLLDPKQAKKTPERILAERARDDNQGLLRFLKTVDKKWTITYDETAERAKYRLNHLQDLAWGAADDRSRDWRALDPRRIEGPIPVECRSASCGTCWVGVLGGSEKLTDVATREGTQIKQFGYIDTADKKPLIRLACQAKAEGAVSIVIPPWNGVFGKYLRSLKSTEPEE